MGSDRAVALAGQTRREQAHDQHAGRGRRLDVRAEQGLSVAGLAYGYAGPQHSLRLFRAVGLRWHADAHLSHAVRAV